MDDYITNDIKLYNKDCLEILKQIPDESIDLVASDPPYRIRGGNASGNENSLGGMFKSKLSCDGKIFEHNDIEPKQYAGEIYRILKKGTHCYIMTNHFNILEMLQEFIKVGFDFTKMLIWMKNNKIATQYYMNQFEYIIFLQKSPHKPINNCGTSDILQVDNIKMQSGDGKNFHDTEKPVELMKILVENSTNIGDVVLDPFTGIGSTGIASKITGRKFIGCEIDEKFYKVAKQRIEEAKYIKPKEVKTNKITLI